MRVINSIKWEDGTRIDLHENGDIYVNVPEGMGVYVVVDTIMETLFYMRKMPFPVKTATVKVELEGKDLKDFSEEFFKNLKTNMTIYKEIQKKREKEEKRIKEFYTGKQGGEV